MIAQVNDNIKSEIRDLTEHMLSDVVTACVKTHPDIDPRALILEVSCNALWCSFKAFVMMSGDVDNATLATQKLIDGFALMEKNPDAIPSDLMKELNKIFNVKSH